MIAAGAGVKGLVAAWAFRAAMARGLMTGRDLARILALWLILVADAVGLAALALPAGRLPVPRWAALVGVAAFVPLVRFALAPLALDWNRHRP